MLAADYRWERNAEGSRGSDGEWAKAKALKRAWLKAVWCHLMDKTTYMDRKVAAILEKGYVVSNQGGPGGAAGVRLAGCRCGDKRKPARAVKTTRAGILINSS